MMAVKSSLCRRTIPEILKPEGAPVEWRLIAWEWIARRVFPILLLFFAGCAAFEPSPCEKIAVFANTEITWPKSTAALKRALAYCRAEKVDSVVFLGDPTMNGYKNQHEVFQSAWKESFRAVQPPQQILAGDPYEIHGISFTGKGKFALSDLLCVHPRKGKRINVGSMHGVEISEIFEKQESKVAGKVKESAQGVLLYVYQTGMKVKRLDFSDKSPVEVGPCWEVDQEGFIHAEESATPEFWPDTRISVVRGYDKKGNPIYTVRWPPVLAKHTGMRAFSYNVSVGNRVIKRVQSKGFYLDEARDAEAVSCVIDEKELNGEMPRFGITPVSSLGRKGKTVWAY